MNTGRASLRTRMIVVALVAILPAVALTFSIQSRDRREARDRTVAENQHIVRLAAEQIADIFEGAQRLHATLKRFPVLMADARQCSAILGRVKDDHPAYHNIGIFNLDGTPFCTAAPPDPRVFRSAQERAWFKRAIESHAFALGDYQSGPDGQATIVVAEPIGGTSGEPLRVLASSLSIAALDSVVDAVDVTRGGVLSLLDSAGTVLALAPDPGGSGAAARVGGRIDQPWFAPLNEMVRQRTAGGDGRMSVTERIDTGSPRQPLYITFSIGNDVVFAGTDRNFRNNLWLLLGVSLLSIGVAAALGHVSVLRPVDAHASQTTRELKDSEDRYKQLFQQHPNPMWVFDRDTLEFLEVNDAAVYAYGYSREEFARMKITDIRPSEDVPAFMTELRERKPVAWMRNVARRHRLKSGALIDVEVTSHSFGLDGRNAVLVIANDVTEQTRTAAARDAAEQALFTTEERMRFALEVADVGVWEANLVTDEAYWSETCERMHGFAPGSFGRSLQAFMRCVDHDDRDRVRQAIDAAVRERRNAEFEYAVTLPDGHRRRIACVGHYTFDERGVPVRGAGVAMDVTEKRSLEQQLQQSHKMEAIGQLAGGVAHDFNNLLTAIQGYSELIADSLEVNDPRRADVAEIQRAGKRAAELTRQLLAFSRKQILSPQVLHVGDAIGQLAPMLRRLLGESIELRTIIANREHVKVDPGQLDQVFMNLAVNASDAMNQQGILTIETADIVIDESFVRAHADAIAAGPHVMISVKDTGCGMDPETLSHMFEPFFTTKPIDRGTGLGLATVYGIVKQSGGSILVSSEVGRGTTFTLYLPTMPGAANEAAVQHEPEALARGIESILVIEDESQVREYVSRVLRRLGYRVTDIDSPSAAVTYAREQASRIDLVLTDVIMPTLSGPDAYKQIHVTHPESAVLFMSGYADRTGTRDGMLAAGAPYLQKPFSPAVLARRVREALEHAAAV